MKSTLGFINRVIWVEDFWLFWLYVFFVADFDFYSKIKRVEISFQIMSHEFIIFNIEIFAIK